MSFTVEAQGCSRVYGRHRALAPVSFTLREGESVAILGPNGAGKSTLCAILSTRLRPTSGQVRYGEVESPSAIRGLIGLCAHDSLCYGDLTGRENLLLFTRLYHVEDAPRRATLLLERVGLSSSAADRPSRTYSRGMLQRLALARALVHAPRLLILDEPFTGLDRGGVELAATLLREEQQRGAIVVTVTHDLDAIAGVSNRALLLARGRLIHDGPAPASGGGLRDLYHAHTAQLTAAP